MGTAFFIALALSCVVLLTGCGGAGKKPAEVTSGADAVEAGAGDASGAVITVTNEVGGGDTGDEEVDAAGKNTGDSEDIADTKPEDEAGMAGDDTYSAEDEFYITEITDDIFDRIYGLSFKEDCTLPREDLRYLHVLHKDINGDVHEGEIIVNVHIAEDVLEIFKQLYENDYPIEKIRLVDEYGADDDKSMEDNNSSGFNYRTVPGSTTMSKHSLGLAIDINTRYNPYVRYKNGQSIITPENGIEYADRDAEFDYKIEKGDLCYNLFIEHGFEWGGEWKNSKDYQHFDVPDKKVREYYP